MYLCFRRRARTFKCGLLMLSYSVTALSLDVHLRNGSSRLSRTWKRENAEDGQGHQWRSDAGRFTTVTLCAVMPTSTTFGCYHHRQHTTAFVRAQGSMHPEVTKRVVVAIMYIRRRSRCQQSSPRVIITLLIICKMLATVVCITSTI